jgi:hypothetical protein
MSVETIISCQTALIAALDAHDADAVQSATLALAKAVEQLRDSTQTKQRGSGSNI